MTGLVDGVNVELMQHAAQEGGFRVEFWQMNSMKRVGERYERVNVSFSSGLAEFFSKNLTTFPCLVNSMVMKPPSSNPSHELTFLMPITPTGLTIVTKVPRKAEKKVSLSIIFAFLKPFEPEVWGMIILLLFLASLVYAFTNRSDGSGDDLTVPANKEILMCCWPSMCSSLLHVAC